MSTFDVKSVQPVLRRGQQERVMNTRQPGTLTERIDDEVVMLQRNALVAAAPKRASDGVNCSKSSGRYGKDSDPSKYDFGNTYSIPKVVVDGVAKNPPA